MPPKAKYLRPSKMVLIVGEPLQPAPLKESGRVSGSAVRTGSGPTVPEVCTHSCWSHPRSAAGQTAYGRSDGRWALRTHRATPAHAWTSRGRRMRS